MAKTKEAPFKIDDTIVFNGYGEDVPDEERLLEEGEQYTVAEVNEKDKSVAVQIENPDFNAKKKESEENAKHILVDVYFTEISIAEEGEGEGEGEGEAEAAEAEAPPARGRTAAKAAAPAKTAAKTTAKPAAKAAAKPAAKTTTKPAAKGKAAPKQEEEGGEEDSLPALESEDEEILALVNDSDNILDLATELVEEGAALDYKLGGVLYHIRLSGEYEKLDKAYAENGGFGLYVKEHLNIEYRKAMYLIDIYYKFNLFGIDAAKVQELGWTKCSKIAAVMTEDNAGELVELAENSSVAELSDTIKESYKEVGGTKGEKRKKVTFKLRLWEDQAAGVQAVLEAVKDAQGLKTLDDAFEHIVMEYGAEHDIAVSPKKTTAKAPAAKAGAAKPAAKAAAKPAAKVGARGK